MKPRTVIPFSHLSSKRIVPVIGTTCSRYLTEVTLESDISPPYYGIASRELVRDPLTLFEKLARDDNSGRIVTRHQEGWNSVLANFFFFFFFYRHQNPDYRAKNDYSPLRSFLATRWMPPPPPLTHGLDHERAHTRIHPSPSLHLPQAH